jgi:hypothetical protein
MITVYMHGTYFLLFCIHGPEQNIIFYLLHCSIIKESEGSIQVNAAEDEKMFTYCNCTVYFIAKNIITRQEGRNFLDANKLRPATSPDLRRVGGVAPPLLVKPHPVRPGNKSLNISRFYNIPRNGVKQEATFCT